MSTTREEHSKNLRRGWTTGACATAASKSAYHALLTGTFLNPVKILLPKGETPTFSLALEETGQGWARAGIVKDAGDDPDVTHGALVIATLRHGRAGTGISFFAGEGVGTITKAGLPIPPGEPAINPVPRALMRAAIEELSIRFGTAADVEIEISVPGGDRIAQKTWNPRLGIVNGISILGTTGVVRPFSCSAWIHSIHRGIDVARAQGLTHLAGATGSMSEKIVRDLHNLPEQALLDMGDFVGGTLKYLRTHPVERLSIAGGFGKMTKLAQGFLDLHSRRGQISFDWLAALARENGASPSLVAQIAQANTAQQALDIARAGHIPLADAIAKRALQTANDYLHGAPINIDIIIMDREQAIVGRA